MGAWAQGLSLGHRHLKAPLGRIHFLAHSWMLAGFSSSWAVILSSRPQSLSSLPRGPLHRACHSMAAYFIRLGNWEESTSQIAITVFCNLMTEVTSHPMTFAGFCQLQASHKAQPTTLYPKEGDYKKAWIATILGGHIRWLLQIQNRLVGLSVG